MLLFVPEIRVPTDFLLSKRNMLILAVWLTGKCCVYPCNFPMTPCFTAPVSWQAVGGNWCAIQLEKQVLPPALLSPFVIGSCSITSYSEAGKEKNVPKMTCCSHLFLIRLSLGEIFALGYVLFPSLTHASSFLSSFSTLTFSYNGKTTSPAV